jgi:hypothetical protein
MESLPSFDIEKSPMREAYHLLGASTPLELSNKYTEEDQKLWMTQAWDYENPDLITNKVKELVEHIDPTNLAENEREWRREIIWFWYHHAISCAIGRYKSRKDAQEFSRKALMWQDADHPNKITRLLDYLVHDDVKGAREWAHRIDEEPEKTTAQNLLQKYEANQFFEGNEF